MNSFEVPSNGGSVTPQSYHKSRCAFCCPQKVHSRLCCGRMYTHRSATVSPKKDILEILPFTKMRRDERPSSYATVTDGCSRFPASSYKGNGTFSRGLGRSRGSSRDHFAALYLGNSGIVTVVGDHCREQRANLRY